MEHLNIEILTEHIIPYVGVDQFRFVAGVNHTFYSAYTSVYNDLKHRTSYKFINTMELFKFCYLEMRDNVKEQRLLFQCAVKQGSHNVLQFLHEIGCSWNVDVSTCAQAALFGHLNVLQWARANGCPWDENTCSEAASNGHLDVLHWNEQMVVHGIKILVPVLRTKDI
jgi:hypothetical protein